MGGRAGNAAYDEMDAAVASEDAHAHAEVVVVVAQKDTLPLAVTYGLPEPMNCMVEIHAQQSQVVEHT